MERIEAVEDFPTQDGFVYAYPGQNFQSDDFKSESEMVDYYSYNIDKFAEELGVKAIAHHINYYLGSGHASRRVDMMIESEDKSIILEFKNPTHFHECRAAIGQLLNYGREVMTHKPVEMILITSKYCSETAHTISHYSLPIRYFFATKTILLEYLRLADINERT